MEGEHPLPRFASVVQLIDYATVYLGIASGVDPTPIEIIQELKERILLGRAREFREGSRHQSTGSAAERPGSGAAPREGPPRLREGTRPRDGRPRSPSRSARMSPAAGPPAAGPVGSLTAVLAAFAANVGIAITKLIAFLLTGSASMLAEFVHSCADCSDQILLLVGRKRARREETEEHPFGFGRERYFYGFLVAVVLFSVGGAYSIYDGVHKIINPEPITDAVHRLRGTDRLGRPGKLVAAHRDQGVQRAPERGRLAARSSSGPRAPTCSSCCWKIRPRWPGSRSRSSASVWPC